MKYAYVNGKRMNANTKQLPVHEMRRMVKQYGATCIKCGESVIFCSGPVKGSYFAHKEKNLSCPDYHHAESTFAASTHSSQPPQTQQYSPASDKLAKLIEESIHRPLTLTEKEHIFVWLYYDGYIQGEVLGALAEIKQQYNGVPERLFNKMDRKLYALTRSKNNPYYKRSQIK